MKKTLNAFVWFSIAGYAGLSLAYDSGPALLGSGIGATDYYKLTCAAGLNGDTDHLAVKLTEQVTASQDEQMLNIRVERLDNPALFVQETAVTPGKTKELALSGGNGKYRLVLDTAGTSPNLTGKQRFSLSMACLNAAGERTKTSLKKKNGRLKLGGTKPYPVKCSKRGRFGDTERLAVTLSNTTAGASKLLNGQLLQDPSAAPLTEGQEVSFRGASAANGNGTYYLTVNNTGTGADNSTQYAFQARCVNSAGQDTAEPLVELFQDQ